eukprot:scaffold1314_cov393-Prasinococcus_capsulatus_cf.AAC.11
MQSELTYGPAMRMTLQKTLGKLLMSTPEKCPLGPGHCVPPLGGSGYHFQQSPKAWQVIYLAFEQGVRCRFSHELLRCLSLLCALWLFISIPAFQMKLDYCDRKVWADLAQRKGGKRPWDVKNEILKAFVPRWNSFMKQRIRDNDLCFNFFHKVATYYDRCPDVFDEVPSSRSSSVRTSRGALARTVRMSTWRSA